MVLIVEDDEETAASLREVIEVMGYKAEVAANGKVALDCLRSAPTEFCLVLLDLSMPVMNGWEFLNEHHADGTISSIPVIIVTAVPKGQMRGAETSAVTLLPKPVDTARLRGALRQYC